MKVLIADDDVDFRMTLRYIMERWGYECVETGDGLTAYQTLYSDDPAAPGLALLDWHMPGINGLDVCRKLRAEASKPLYLLVLTARTDKDDMITGLRSGADDYLTKPFEPRELEARLEIGRRMLDLQCALARRVKELEDALARERHLEGLLPICAWCKKVRDDQNYWEQVEDYLSKRTDIRFTHGVCPECYQKTLAGVTSGD